MTCFFVIILRLVSWIFLSKIGHPKKKRKKITQQKKKISSTTSAKLANKPIPLPKKQVIPSLEDNNKVRGIIGENTLFETLNKLTGQKNIFRNVYFRTSKGTLTEIDLVLVTPKAIFVIENKNHSGVIYGNANSAHWTEYYGSQKYTLYNPIMQNSSHLRAFWNSAGAVLTDEKKNDIHSIIVFNDSCKLNVTSPDIPVLHCNELLPYINGELKKSRKTFNEKQLSYMCNLLQMNSSLSDDIKKQHIAYVQTVQKKQAQTTAV